MKNDRQEMENGKSVFCLLLCSAPPPDSPRCEATERAEACAAWQAIIEVALHFPAPNIELPPRATIETSPVGLTLT